MLQQRKGSDEQNQHKASQYWSNFGAGVLLWHWRASFCATSLISFPVLHHTVDPCTFETLYPRAFVLPP